MSQRSRSVCKSCGSSYYHKLLSATAHWSVHSGIGSALEAQGRREIIMRKRNYYFSVVPLSMQELR